MPSGTFPSTHRKIASPLADRTRTVLPDAIPISFMSSGCMFKVLTVA